MAGNEDLIDFDVIESHKENIQALPSGRSAKALAQLYSPALGAQASPALAQDAHTKQRAVFEQELQHIDEADDPLEVYDRYVKWTMDAYPSAQATPQSQLRSILERATQAFQKSSHYKNDPRYLKLWLHYIRLFSDAPREVFVFLARHGIGEGLALYYEEYAAWLENSGRWVQAEEIYKLGIEKDVRPVERLLRKFGEFERRLEARPQDALEPTSPALPSVRPVLAAKVDPIAGSSTADSQQQPNRSAATKKSKSSKMAVFSDVDEQSRPHSGSSSNGWDNIGTIAERKKENKMEAGSWAGAKLKGGKTNGGMEKLMVFKDESRSLPKHIQRSLSGSNHDPQCVPNPKTGRIECVFVNLEAVYPEVGKRSKEYCLEELRARGVNRPKRPWDLPAFRPRLNRAKTSLIPPPGLEPRMVALEQDVLDLSITEPAPTTATKHRAFAIFADVPPPQVPAQAQSKSRQRGFVIFEDVPSGPQSMHKESEQSLAVETVSQTLALNDENDENAAPPTQKDVQKQLRREQRREERANRTRKIQVMNVKHIKNETKTIQINLDSPTGRKIKRKKSSDRTAEPTMTINTKEAMDEIYGIFNQPLAAQDAQSEDDDEDSEDEYTTGDESTGTGKLSGPPSEYGEDTRNDLLVSQKSAEGAHGSRADESEWSDFTTSKHVPKEAANDADASATPSTGWEMYQNETESGGLVGVESPDDLVNPLDEDLQTRYVPVPPEDYEPPRGQYRNMTVMANNRLPFMTPIVEQTETSLGTGVPRTAKTDDLHFKTPSRKNGSIALLPEDEEPSSSPFQDVTSEIDLDKQKVLQPIRTKSTKGTISLGQGSAKSQIAAKTTLPLIAESMQDGPIVKDLQCNPMDPHLRESILSQIKPSLSSFVGYFEHLDQTSGKTSEIRKYIKTAAKATKSGTSLDKTALTLSLPPVLSFDGADGRYTVKRELGAGTFAPVYLIENSTATALNDDDDMNDENGPPVRVGKSAYRRGLEAIKMEDPPSTWEFYILQQSHRRLGVSRAADSIVRAHEMHVFQDECFLVEEYRDQGTLLDLVNLARLDSGSGGGMDETMAMWFTVELLRTTEALHAKQLIHGDLKGDNVLVRFDDPGAETDWSPTYFANGAHGWAAKGVCLIDFGRGIDATHFAPAVGFVADWKTSEADCAEMRELRPWTYQIDYHGLAGIVHSMLFGKYMETVGEKGAALGQGATKTYRIRENLKRYWQTDLWTEVFQLLLNPLAHLEAEAGHRLPVLRGMKGCRERMEAWLEEHSERGMGLKGMITKMESAIREKRRRSVRSG